MPTVRDVVSRFEKRVPKNLSVPKDPIGLHFGDWNQEVKVIMTTLDIRPSVIEEAIAKKVDLIIAHHPPIFRPVVLFDLTVPQNKMFQQILKHDIAVYAAHTNLDVVEGGVNDWLADELLLTDVTVMSPTTTIPSVKVITYVHKNNAEKVLEAMFEAGAGAIGDNYKDCAFQTSGVGQFTPVKGANPAIGSLNKPEFVEEVKLEVVCSEKVLSDVLKSLRASHPYEEPAIDVFSLKNAGKTLGFGRVGNLSKEMTQEEFITFVTERFKLKGLRYVPSRVNPDGLISRVAVMGGSGGNYYMDALKNGADAFVTGDIFYHTAHDIQETSLFLVDAGHHIEVVCRKQLAKWAREWKEENNWDVTVIESETFTDPFEFYKAGEENA